VYNLGISHHLIDLMVKKEMPTTRRATRIHLIENILDPPSGNSLNVCLIENQFDRIQSLRSLSDADIATLTYTNNWRSNRVDDIYEVEYFI